MERYCAYQERCHKEVHQKLKEIGMIPDAIDQIIHHLLQHDFLNETRFSQAYEKNNKRVKNEKYFKIQYHPCFKRNT